MHKFSKPDDTAYQLTFKGFLAVRLMGFDHGGKHYSYHGRKLMNAVRRLTAPDGPQSTSVAELVIWGQAVDDWEERVARTTAQT